MKHICDVILFSAKMNLIPPTIKLMGNLVLLVFEVIFLVLKISVLVFILVLSATVLALALTVSVLFCHVVISSEQNNVHTIQRTSNLFSKCMTMNSIWTDAVWQAEGIGKCSIWTETRTTRVRLCFCLAFICICQNVKFWPLWDDAWCLDNIDKIGIRFTDHT